MRRDQEFHLRTLTIHPAVEVFVVDHERVHAMFFGCSGSSDLFVAGLDSTATATVSSSAVVLDVVVADDAVDESCS